MITELRLLNVGPIDSVDLRFLPGLNVLTGDNGIGKTFVLETIWATITTILDGISGFRGIGTSPSEIGALFEHRDGPNVDFTPQATWSFDRLQQQWVRGWHLGRRTPGFKTKEHKTDEAQWRPQSLVLYVKADGAISIWDSYIARSKIANFPEAAIELSSSAVWDGLQRIDPKSGSKQMICPGFIEDVARWQGAKSPEFAMLSEVLGVLSSPDIPIAFDASVRVSLSDRRDIPTLRLPYGTVPVTVASAGIRRILGLSYALVWAWKEHKNSAMVVGLPPTRDIVVMIDEIEAHLHPLWQRVVIPSLQKAIRAIAPEAGIQLFVSTHAPLILASLEPVFDSSKDALFSFDLDTSRQPPTVTVERAAWRKRGDVSNWLTSDIFDLSFARSKPAEDALKDAIKALRSPNISVDEVRAIQDRLRAVLGDTEAFWARWLDFAEKKGVRL